MLKSKVAAFSVLPFALLYGSVVSASDIGQTGNPWTKYYGTALASGAIDGYSDYGADILREPSGNLYVTGGYNSYAWGVVSSRQTAFNFFIAKYDANGTQVWLKQLTTGQQHNDYGSELARDSSGNIYVTGYTDGNTFAAPSAPTTWVQNNFLAKYDTNGNQIWIRYYGSATADTAQKLVIGPSNGIFIAGYTAEEGTTNYDAVLYRFDTSGNQLWRKKYNNDGLQEMPVGVAYEANTQNLFVATNQYNPLAPYYDTSDIVIRRIALDGTFINDNMKFATSQQDRVHTIVSGGAAGGVYIAGRAGQGAFGPTDPTTINPNGIAQYFVSYVGVLGVSWVNRLATEEGALNFSGMALDPFYRLHVTGATGKNAAGNITGGYVDPNNWGTDILYLLYGAGGWHVNQDQMGAYGVADRGSAIEVDDRGNFFITGAVYGSMNGINSSLAVNISSSNILTTRNDPR